MCILNENATSIRRLLLTSLIFNVSLTHASVLEFNLTEFSLHDLSNWETKSFNGHTDYQTIDIDNLSVLKAYSNDSASGLALERKIDLLKTPFINWSWRIENRLTEMNEQTKEGDDYAARIYLIIDGGWAVWNTKALNFVWSSNQAKGTNWNNAYAGDNAKMVAIRGKEAERKKWYTEKQNVYQSLIEAFGDKGSEEKNLNAYRYIDVTAIMTDTDDSHQSTTAYYGDIIFSAK
ncbi:DUF3047 domain-containing protein [Vibrio algarum]|uniref:DUF3047 domain-containing protein n=1 Tax=Vibrio algarum TaxID=3020714 RepID=A0ABT4YQZ4_9VIBR|nr:DUF3047 domain-containing protein [Vibrio sp. KJ40-1]MDB1123979.1 DUF3047 domain-containing protein [Vibrio sp. KJ40-1]